MEVWNNMFFVQFKFLGRILVKKAMNFFDVILTVHRR